MIFNQHCYNLDIKYYEELIEINIENIRNNIEKFRIYNHVLESFKLNKVDMVIKYCDKEYLVYNEIDLKRIFKNFIHMLIYFNSLVSLSRKSAL